MADVVYGCRVLRVCALDTDGGVPATPTWVSTTTPQQVTFTPVTITGNQSELRGGDSLLAVIQEDDTPVGMDFTFINAKLDGALLVAMVGGTHVTATNTYTPLMLGETPPAFKAELYVAKYGEGAQHEGDNDGFILLIFNNCRSSLPSFTAQDRNFLLPSLTVKGRENITDSLSSWTFEDAAALP